MSNLNLFHAQEADLKCRVADTGLACDSPRGAPDSKDIDAFRLAMEEENQNLPQEKEPFSDEASQSQLSSMFSMGNSFSLLEAAGRVDAVHAVLTEDELNALVERILVSAADDGTKEVRLTLNEHFLNGTEIVLSRALDGRLTVALNCIDPSVFQTLVSSQFSLKSKLEEHEMLGVEVTVNIDQEGNDPDRRSRNFYALDSDDLWKTDNA